MAMWFGISVPLIYAGNHFGRKKEEIKNPCKTNLIPRRVPDQPWYMRSPFSILMGGILPFGAVFIELFFILTSIWLHRYYYVFGFLFIVFIILIVTCAEITIVMIYFQLCSGVCLLFFFSLSLSFQSPFAFPPPPPLFQSGNNPIRSLLSFSTLGLSLVVEILLKLWSFRILYVPIFHLLFLH